MKNKVSLVTGSTSGIGRTIARFFSKLGAKVVVHGRDEEQGAEVLNNLCASGGDAIFVPADLSDAQQCHALITSTWEHYGSIDILVNNAGRNVFTGVMDTTLEDWQACLDTDLRAAWLLAKEAIPHMPRGSAIINISSNHAYATIPGCFPYNVAKAGMLALTQSLALELASRGIRVNTICPGYIDTPINDSYFATFPDPDRERQRVIDLHPVGRLGSPIDIAHAARFLALEEESGFITGTQLLIDGGRNALLQDPS